MFVLCLSVIQYCLFLSALWSPAGKGLTSCQTTRWCFFCGSFMLFLSCLCCAFVCVCLLMPCGQLLGRADLLALVCDVLV